MKGYKYAEANGLNEALFKSRVLKNIFKTTKKEIYSFFLGAVMMGEMKNILDLKADRIIIGGKGQLRDAMAEIIRAVSEKEVVVISDDVVKISSFAGMVKIFECC